MSHQPEADPGPSTTDLDQMYVAVYDELRRLVSGHLKKRRRIWTLQTTAVVHELYLRLASKGYRFENRGRFFGLAGRAVRNLITDLLRRRDSEKAGGGKIVVTLDSRSADSRTMNEDAVIDLTNALAELSRRGGREKRGAEQITLRYFVGLTAIEAAGALGISNETAKEDWRYARAWLRRRLDGRI